LGESGEGTQKAGEKNEESGKHSWSA
jgi:hypothetical protein